MSWDDDEPYELTPDDRMELFRSELIYLTESLATALVMHRPIRLDFAVKEAKKAAVDILHWAKEEALLHFPDANQ